MIITTLVENLSVSNGYKSKHGLSFHIKTKNHNILFDLGPDNSFLENAKKLNIDVSDVDIAIISHGHSDHGGGLESFLKNNNKAKVYINKNAFGLYYTSILKYGKYYIGLNRDLKDDKRIILTDDNFKIDEDILLFSNVDRKEFLSTSNKSLLKKEGDLYLEDDFRHEQNLILKEGDKHILISGCSHCGVVNILDKASKILNENIDISIGGLHLCKPSTKKIEKEEFIRALGENLKERDTKFYTCHCTGEKPFSILKDILGEKIDYLKTGSVLEI